MRPVRAVLIFQKYRFYEFLLETNPAGLGAPLAGLGGSGWSVSSDLFDLRYLIVFAMFSMYFARNFQKSSIFQHTLSGIPPPTRHSHPSEGGLIDLGCGYTGIPLRI